jgi:alkyl hydroperoxide reductase subunit AhpC
LIEKNRRDAVEVKERHVSYDSNTSHSSWTETLEDEAGVSIKNIQDPTGSECKLSFRIYDI